VGVGAFVVGASAAREAVDIRTRSAKRTEAKSFLFMGGVRFGLRLDCLFSFFLGSNADSILDVRNKDFTVADFPGFG